MASRTRSVQGCGLDRSFFASLDLRAEYASLRLYPEELPRARTAPDVYFPGLVALLRVRGLNWRGKRRDVARGGHSSFRINSSRPQLSRAVLVPCESIGNVGGRRGGGALHLEGLGIKEDASGGVF